MNGSDIHSPSVDPHKRYWGARTIQVLVDVGYLSQAEASVAKRADGILAGGAPNGKLGATELALLESPEHIGTLFPEERAVIPKLWKILEIDDARDITPTSPTIPTAVHADQAPAPFSIPIATLHQVNGANQDDVQRLAQRIELTHDSDHDPSTLSGLDIEAAYADRGSFLSGEVGIFEDIHRQIGTAASHVPFVGHLVETPAESDVDLFRETDVAIIGRVVPQMIGSWSRPNDPIPMLDASTIIETDLIGSTTKKIVLIDRSSGDDRLVDRSATAANARIEIWNQGARTHEFDVSSVAPVFADVPFGYTVKIGTLSYALSCKSDVFAGASCSYVSVDQAVKLVPESYRVAGHDDYRLDIYPGGDGRLVHGGQSDVCYPSFSGSSGQTGCVGLTDGKTFTVTFQDILSDTTDPTFFDVILPGPLGVLGLYVY